MPVEQRSEEHTSELQSHSFISYAVFCLKKKEDARSGLTRRGCLGGLPPEPCARARGRGRMSAGREKGTRWSGPIGCSFMLSFFCRPAAPTTSPLFPSRSLRR